ncbi:MAG: hypothetical protein Harvfovirus4_18 [Harvfovirus sp.]|uniref:Uncharacterized protein n=1 Tax=Harvfovirus sp. TaxID=2487768 RepID=A0A3G5A2B9_9VIRU|nr:MAG: hypothetical protein Harvfovirus4_18 [Harvfovirus sp.]
MAALCEEAEAYVLANKVDLDDHARNKLAKYDAHKQMQWLVNPVMMFCIEQTMNQLLWERQNSSTAAELDSTETEETFATTQDGVEPEPDPDDEPGMFDLFG